MVRLHTLAGELLGLMVLAGCQDNPSVRTPPPNPRPAPAESLAVAVGDSPQTFPGLHNVCRVSEKLISGGVPEDDEGFASLKKLGVKTVISVDGARPDVERAHKLDMRYVHLPIGYDGVPRDQALRLARAVRDLPGQVYVHCHHGEHRSPAAAVAVNLCLDGTCTSEKALAFLKQAGTGPNYKGLYAATGQFQAISNEELDKVPADFPEVAALDDFVKLMVNVEKHFDHLKQIQTAGWKAPAKAPDLEGPHEALLLREAYTELARLPEAKQRGDELHRWLLEAEKHARALEDAIRAAKEPSTPNGVAIEAAFKQAGSDCPRCHGKYRDVPQR